MEIYEIKRKKKELDKAIEQLLKDFCSETGMEFQQSGEIRSYYTSNTSKEGSYTIDLKISNPLL